MALSNLIEKIIADGTSEAQVITDQAQTEVAQINKETERLVSEAIIESEKKINDLKEVETKRQISSHKGKNQREIEKHKRQAIDDVFKMAEKELISLSENDRLNICKKLLATLPSNWSGEIFASEAESPILKNLGVNVTVDKNIKGGFIATSQDSEYNFTWSSLVKDSQSKMENKVAEILFKA